METALHLASLHSAFKNAQHKVSQIPSFSVFARLALVGICSLLTLACASTQGAAAGAEATLDFRRAMLDESMLSKALPLGRSEIVLRFEKEDGPSSQAVAEAVEAALPALARWGDFHSPIVLTIHPTHEALEEAVNRRNHAFLRAWARYDTIELQSPRTWGIFAGRQSHLQELITHELTHCLMYQLAATPGTWQRKGIPLWFREGMASVTASQGYRRAKDSDLWRYLRANPDKDPILNANALYQWESEIVYAAAHRAFEFLLLRYSQERVVEVMRVMREEEVRFPEAFERVIGIGATEFAEEFIRYLRWEGWRQG